MDFAISEEQEMLADSVARFIDNEYTFEQRQKIVESDSNFSAQHWQMFADLGFTAVPFSEEDGGLAGGPVELMLMMEQFGRGLLVEPYLANIVLAGGVLRRAASNSQKTKWLAPVIDGQLQAGLAIAEPQARFQLNDIKTTATISGDDYLLNGKKTLVLNGGDAQILIVSARTSANQCDDDGITLFAMPTDANGVSIAAYATVDGLAAADVEIKDVELSSDNILGETDGGFDTLMSVVDEGTLAVCAEAIGIMRTMHEKTVEYAKSRVQFGVPIGSFQALQHRMVETLMLCEQSQSLLLWTVMKSASGDPELRQAVSALKYQVGTAGVHVAREAVQIHGGMGVTWELDIAHFFKRLTAIDLMFGNADFHLDRYIALTR